MAKYSEKSEKSETDNIEGAEYPCSPFNYNIDEEVEREKALKRAADHVINDPSRPIL